MKKIEDILLQRSSVRTYDPSYVIPQEDINTILQSIQQSPTYIGGQQYSVIVVDDKEQKEAIMRLSLGSSGKEQEHIRDCSVFLLFVVDFNKIYNITEYEGVELEIVKYMEGLLIGSVDIGIGIEAATVCAESLGYGTVVIGALRCSVRELIELYKLPRYTFPLLGLCIGRGLERLAPRPRLAISSFAHHNEYKLENFDSVIEEQNRAVAEFYKDTDEQKDTWSHFIANFYKKGYRKELLEVYRSQGFDIK